MPAFIKVFLREMKRIVTGHSTRLILFYIPLIVFPLLALIYQKGALRDIPVAVWDQDHSDLSRMVTRFIDASHTLKVTDYLSASDNPETFFPTHREKAVFHIPKGFKHDIMKGKSTRIQVFTNSSNIVFGNILLREAYTIAGTVNGGILLKKYKASGLTNRQAMIMVQPIKVHTHSLFNPYYNYLYYLVPGLLTVLLQMVVFFISTRAFNSEVNNGTFDELVAAANGKPLNMLTGKALAYLLTGLYVTGLIALIFMIFGIPFQQKEGELLLLFGYFTLVNVFLGFMLSTTIRDEILSLDVAFLYNSPAFVFSGFTFPIFAMPFISSSIAQFIPYTHFLHAFFKLYQFGAPLSFAAPDFYRLTLFLAVGFVTSYIALHIKLKQKSFNPKTSLQHG
ncbi:ABC transporter permease [Candidatus Sulfidibacterium hydrothermale]|uniref:ABC transporter permease n=1 Tax=Candidatus Sulfidibacterium hydrothermale TaxID=2875962 RepID=UPI001F0A1746|nr:ABC transporter permease [Candidatus Sulfidibacterium hydrothermale]UBM61074.1 ABC transporter permease [Candidatus Sulfidibacterium hydrothermale]